MIGYSTWRWKVAQAAEIRWWTWYLGDKTPEDYLSRKRAYWHRLLGQAGLELPDEMRVLDAGCGPAGVFMVLPHCRVDALDPLVDAYADRLIHFDPAMYPWVRFRASRLEDLRPGPTYPLIFCMNAINHVADLDRCLENLAEALLPGGTLVLGVDVHRSPRWKRLFRLAPGDLLHPQQHSLGDYRDRLLELGLKLRNVQRLKSGRIFNYVLLLMDKPA